MLVPLIFLAAQDISFDKIFLGYQPCQIPDDDDDYD
jgi:hypothetical protein